MPRGRPANRAKEGRVRRKTALECIGNPGQGYLAGTHHLAVGIECLRQFHADEARINELHKSLLEWQKICRKEMKTISHDIDVSKLVEKVRSRIQGKSLRDALFLMAFEYPLIDLVGLSANVSKTT